MVFRRRKGVAIVETEKGILVVATTKKKFMLPGGGAEKWETRRKAAIRELYEETGLKTKRIKYLFHYIGDKFYKRDGKPTRNYSKVFLIDAQGIPKPSNEIKYIDFYKVGNDLKILPGTEKIILKYLAKYKK